jgi:hypothetical protein
MRNKNLNTCSRPWLHARVSLSACRPQKKAELKPGECGDSHEQCAEWAYFGECEKNPGFMLASCKKSCKKCEKSSSWMQAVSFFQPNFVVSGFKRSFVLTGLHFTLLGFPINFKLSSFVIKQCCSPYEPATLYDIDMFSSYVVIRLLVVMYV